jgi:hypothetical protein
LVHEPAPGANFVAKFAEALHQVLCGAGVIPEAFLRALRLEREDLLLYSR